MLSKENLIEQVSHLYETIQQQVHQYCTVLDQLQQLSTELQQQQQQVRVALSELEDTVRRHLEEFHRAAKATEAELKEKSKAILHLYNELSDIVHLKHDLKQLQKEIEKQLQDFQKLTQSLDIFVAERTTALLESFERRMNFQFDKLEKSLSAIEDRFLSLYDRLRRENEALRNDLDDFRHRIPETKFLVDEAMQIINSILSDTEKSLENRVQQARADIQRLIEAATPPDVASIEQLQQQVSEVEATLAQIRKDYKALQRNQQFLRTLLWVFAAGTFAALGLSVFLILAAQ